MSIRCKRHARLSCGICQPATTSYPSTPDEPFRSIPFTTLDFGSTTDSSPSYDPPSTPDTSSSDFGGGGGFDGGGGGSDF